MKFVEAVRILNGFDKKGKHPLRVYLASGFTPLHLQTFLAAHLQVSNPNRAVQIETGLFGDLEGNAGKIKAALPDAGVIAVEWQDLDPRLGFRSLGGWLPSQLPEIAVEVAARAKRIGDAITDTASRVPLVVYSPTLPLPPIAFQPGIEASIVELEIRAAWSEVCVRLSKISNVRLVNEQRLAHKSPPGTRLDLNSDLRSGFPYSVEHAAALGEIVAEMLLLRTPKKGIITDLDNTLWSGIVGDAGPGDVHWSLEDHAQLHGLYQQLLSSLGAAGVLIGVASKNDPEPVNAAFARADIILKKETVFPFEIHWKPKSESVHRILEAWNVGADSVVFIDDSPLELEEVKRLHPEVECIAFPKDPNQFFAFLVRLRDLFGKTVLSAEDTIRLDSLRNAGEARRMASEGGESANDFLASLDAELTLAAVEDPGEARPLELVNKTNQFNLNGKRWQAADWKQYLERQDTVVHAIGYSDRFGPLGTIAILGGRKDGDRLLVDFWVMSCRAFSRRIEYECLKLLFEQAHEIELDFRATPKNGPLREFLTELCGRQLDAEEKLSLRCADFAAKCPPLSIRSRVLAASEA